MFHYHVKDRDDSETSADASQSLLSQLPSPALFPVEDGDSAPIDTSVWFEQSMLCAHNPSCYLFLAAFIERHSFTFDVKTCIPCTLGFSYYCCCSYI